MSKTGKRGKSGKIGMVLVLLMPVLGFCEEVKDADSKITAVTVYSDRALVTRLGNIKGVPGTVTAVFSKLPLSIDDRSVRATTSEKGVKIIGIETKQKISEKAIHGRLAQLDDQMQAIQDDVRVLQDTLDVLKSKEAFLESLKAAKADKSSKEMMAQPATGIKDWTDMMTFVETGLKDIQKERRQTNIAARDLQKKLHVLEYERQNLTSGRTEQFKEVRVTMELPANGKADLHLQYVIPGASWSPLYDARVLSTEGKVELVYYGTVSQRTGEDWNEVEVVLSTAKPAIGGQLASLSPWFLTVQEYVQKMKEQASRSYGHAQQKGERMMAQQQMVQFAKAQEAQEAQEMAKSAEEEGKGLGDDLVVADTETSTTSVFFTVKKKETIPSDGQPHKTAIAVENFPATFEYDASPVLSPYAYLKAKLKNGDRPLLAGTMNVFFDQDFAGNSWIKNTQSGESFDAYFGVDEGVKVERRLEKKDAGADRSLLGGGKTFRTTYVYKLSAQNFKKVPVTFNMKDRLPVSQHQDVKVENVRIEPEPTDRTAKGLVRWTVELKPQEKRVFTVEYTIEHPVDKNIVTGLGE